MTDPGRMGAPGDVLRLSSAPSVSGQIPAPDGRLTQVIGTDEKLRDQWNAPLSAMTLQHQRCQSRRPEINLRLSAEIKLCSDFQKAPACQEFAVCIGCQATFNFVRKRNLKPTALFIVQPLNGKSVFSRRPVSKIPDDAE